MPSALLIHNLVATRTIERQEQALAHRRRKQAVHARSRSGWRERIGWLLVEAGLRLTASAPPSRLARPRCL